MLTAILISPMIVPVVVVAVGIYDAFAAVGLLNALAGLVLAHTALGAPFVVTLRFFYDVTLDRVHIPERIAYARLPVSCPGADHGLCSGTSLSARPRYSAMPA